MGLAERRKIKEFQDTILPGRVKEIEEICGQPIPYEVDWETFSDDMEALHYMDNVACHRLNMALRVICLDDMGKEAIRETVKKIKINNVKEVAGKSLRFADGALDMQGSYAHTMEGAFSDNEIRELLMKHL